MEAVVFGEKKSYVGTSNVLGQETVALYDPIFDKDGEVIGIKAIAVPQAPYLAILAEGFWSKIIINTLMAIGALIILSLYVEYALSRPIRKLSANAEDLASLKLDGRILEMDGNDELATLAKSFKQVQLQLKDTISLVSESAEQVANSSKFLAESSSQTSEASSQIAISMNDLADGTTEQSDQIDHLLKEVNNTIREVTACLQTAEATFSNATESTEIAKQVAATTEEQHTTVEELSASSEELSRVAVTLEDEMRKFKL